MIIASLLSLAVALYCFAISQLQMHGKLKWMKPVDILDHEKYYGFWDDNSWKNKYKLPLQESPKNLYYKLSEISYKERFPLSATLLVFTTDGYHLFQALFFSFLSLSFAFAIGFT